jgi:hypothetical protein
MGEHKVCLVLFARNGARLEQGLWQRLDRLPEFIDQTKPGSSISPWAQL